ncbi:hypothetical protein OG705_29340 [Streptomyces sp. NBC_00838]|uniref:hypothetical protein n=1 Tax=Streptomyces sp. NBC_00838 TaxID=2903680 RepID=UPI003870B96C|nr:hypothetical protein OG705_29340 [Streptomyces sp. NBC_00838]
MTKHKTTEMVDATIQLFAELNEMVGLISRVLAKFPAKTVPQRLKPFLGSPSVAFARPSVNGDGEILLELGMSRKTQVRIPGEWLTMHQSELTSAVRKVYWHDREHSLRRELIGLQRSIADHNQQVAHHRAKASESLREHERIAASIRRLSARKRSPAGGDSDD